MRKILILPLILLPFLAVFATTSQALLLTVETSKSSYEIGETIEIFGNLTYNGLPVGNASVAIEVVNPNNDPVVLRTLQTNGSGYYYLAFKLSSDSLLGKYRVHATSSYEGETATATTIFEVFQMVQTTVNINGKNYTLSIKGNATITEVTATETALHFNVSGLFGKTAYINVTLPKDLNNTQIKVFIDRVQLVPPPYPIITSNSTHYFVYFEFTLSTHRITIQYAEVTDIAIENITLSNLNPKVGETLTISVTVKNLGTTTETLSLLLNYTRLLDPTIGNYTITLEPNQTAIINYTWTPTQTGRYRLTAYTSQIPNDTNPNNNKMEVTIYVRSQSTSYTTVTGFGKSLLR